MELAKARGLHILCLSNLFIYLKKKRRRSCFFNKQILTASKLNIKKKHLFVIHYY